MKRAPYSGIEYREDCRACSSMDISASDYDGGKELSCKVTCGKCGFTWREFYEFSHWEEIKG